MKLTLKQRREIVERFLAGESVGTIGPKFSPMTGSSLSDFDFTRIFQVLAAIEQVLRDYMSGKFKLKGKS